MALKMVSIPYEYFIRLAPEGGIAGAHYRELQIITDGAKLVSRTESDAMPLTVGGAKMEELFGKVSAGLALNLEAVEQELASTTQQLDTATRFNQELAGHVEVLRETLTEQSTAASQAVAKLTEAAGALVQAEQRIADLEAQLAANQVSPEEQQAVVAPTED